LVGLGNAQESSYPTWKHELQDLLGQEQTGKADRATFDALVSYLEELDLMDDQLEKGYDGMGGYLGFQIYLDNNREWLMDTLRYDEDEGLDEIEEDEEAILEEDEEEDLDLDMFGEDEEDLEFDDADIDMGDVKRGFAGFGGGEGGDALFSFHSIGFDIGMYGPSMSYWNNEFIDDSFVNQSAGGSQTMSGFSMSPMFQGSATFKLGTKIRVSLSGGMWSGTAKAENLSVYGELDENGSFVGFGFDTTYADDPEVGFPAGHEYAGLQYYGSPKVASATKDLAVSMMPTTAIIAYEVLNGLYVGAGIGSNSITQKITDTYTNPNTGVSVVEEQEFTGSGSRTIVCVGYEMPLGPLSMGFQGNYVLGKYDQEVSDGYGTQDVEVGTDGIQIMVNLGYRFGE
tara:strand:- start:84027 stop:85223 length:1197 start_codon:yes stop_codon:yes gene_type:complete